MKYRVVQKSNDLYYLQYRGGFIWFDSKFGPFWGEEDALRKRDLLNRPYQPGPHIIRILK